MASTALERAGATVTTVDVGDGRDRTATATALRAATEAAEHEPTAVLSLLSLLAPDATAGRGPSTRRSCLRCGP
ncbi:hypothetical protein [Streptomyces sp. KL116D]|uniref:hypothetical protein n=1 Tax=Streptomyces sp. KL116D TaxID=3045152 RepID=UPI003559068A